MAESIPVPIPFKGLNTLNPFIDWQSGFARELTNYALFNGNLLMRPGVEVERQSSATGSIRRTVWFDNAANRSIISNGDVINTETRAVVASVGGACLVPVTRCKHISLDLAIGAREPRGATSPFTAWTFTTNTITATSITSAVSYKGRLCVCDGSTIEFSPVGNITGNMSSASGGGAFPISYLMEGQTVLRMFANSIQNGNYADSIFIIFGNQGKVIVYQGSYPGSADWQIIGNFDMPAPGSAAAFVQIDGDILVCTGRYAYWFSQLFSGGSQTAYDSSPTRPIENLWQLMIWEQELSPFEQYGPFAFYYEPLDCIIMAPRYASDTPQFDVPEYIANYQNLTVYFAYFRKYDAWAFWVMTPFQYPVIPDPTTQLPFATTEVGNIVTLNDYRVYDQYYEVGVGLRYYAITTSWKTPYYYPQSGRTRNLSGVQPFYRNTENGYFHLLQAIFDFSDLNAPFGFYSQPTAITPITPAVYTNGKIIVSTASSNTYKEFCGLGGEGACFSLQFTQQPVTDDYVSDHQMQINLASIAFNEGANYPA